MPRFVAALIAVPLVLAGCSSSTKSVSTASAKTTIAASPGSAAATTVAPVSGKVGVILPDSKSSVRWETADRK